MNAQALAVAIKLRWPTADVGEDVNGVGVRLDAGMLPDVVRILKESDSWLAGIIAEDMGEAFVLSYPFQPKSGVGWLTLRVRADARSLPSIAEVNFAADWQEREIEDLFGLHFAGHPALGDFVLHDDEWPENVAPMRIAFADDGSHCSVSNLAYRPPRVLHADGAFTMPVGPIYSDVAESAQFLLETIGEEIVSTQTRLFYKYRGLEKIAEGQDAWRVVLLAERLNGTSAIAHAVACAQALETIANIEPPPRARRLRVVAAELERLRSHIATIAAVCKSTGLSVPTNHAYSLLESVLRLSCRYLGHRYLFGFVIPGGVSLDLADADVRALASDVERAAAHLAQLGEDLSFDNSFLDRIEEVGVIAPSDATRYGLLGPVGRASGRSAADLRLRVPYADYAALVPAIPIESEGDGYARLRIFLAEAAESSRLLTRAAESIRSGPIGAPCPPAAGAALGWSEAPAGACVHWLRLDESGRIARWRIMPPAFVNWHAFHLAAESFAFQDFPITLATVGLCVAESDR